MAHTPYQLITEVKPKPNAENDEHIVQWQYRQHSSIIHTKEFPTMVAAIQFKEELKYA